MASHREVVYTELFDSDRKELESSVERWDEIFRAVEWALCRAPEKGQETSAYGIFARTTDDWPEVPPLVVYYIFDENEVTVLSVRLADIDPDGDEG